MKVEDSARYGMAKEPNPTRAMRSRRCPPRIRITFIDMCSTKFRLSNSSPITLSRFEICSKDVNFLSPSGRRHRGRGHQRYWGFVQSTTVSRPPGEGADPCEINVVLSVDLVDTASEPPPWSRFPRNH
ncbi:hypothetical protein QR680_007070 [Steinernema hermaphroditum]|uniref:Uncharacterized protein n=1 Tax=Steinernema hermaphroditum TaxID=289476 RepID=A0AA39LY69_9BILA|nr:hypothetical protein QR680_007070 [Steinernema hermaphroditum]